MVKVGDHVIYVDPVARQNNALVTAVWGPTCINIVIINDDPKSEDAYGRQIARHTSLLNKSVTPAHGQYWMLPGEEPNPIVQAIEK